MTMTRLEQLKTLKQFLDEELTETKYDARCAATHGHWTKVDLAIQRHRRLRLVIYKVQNRLIDGEKEKR